MRHILVILLITLTGQCGLAQAQETLYLEGKAEWERRAWPTAYVPLREYRLARYGRRPDVDYMLGTSGCRIDGLKTWGGNMLHAMLYAYPLTLESRRVVRQELRLCRDGSPDGIDGLRLARIDWPPAGMNAVFKTFYWSDDTQPVATYPMRRVRTFEREHFTRRLVATGDREAALAMAASQSPNGHALVSQRLILISESGHSDAEIEEISSGLNQYMRFLESEYRIGRLEHYVTIYLVDSSAKLQERAQQLHGLDVSLATLGYAYADDLSLIAFVPGTASGTVLHELFHLLVRSEYGNIPQWLDEGIGSLYEVSVTDGTRYWGVDNWRGEVLRTLWDEYRPTVEELIRSDWYLFDDPAQADAMAASARDPFELVYRQDESARQAAMMATARYFALYLQETGQLRDLFATMRSSDPASIENREIDPRDYAVEVVETALGESLYSIDDEFSDWFLGGGAEAASGVVPSLPRCRQGTAGTRLRSDCHGEHQAGRRHRVRPDRQPADRRQRGGAGYCGRVGGNPPAQRRKRLCVRAIPRAKGLNHDARPAAMTSRRPCCAPMPSASTPACSSRRRVSAWVIPAGRQAD